MILQGSVHALASSKEEMACCPPDELFCFPQSPTKSQGVGQMQTVSCQSLAQMASSPPANSVLDPHCNLPSLTFTCQHSYQNFGLLSTDQYGASRILTTVLSRTMFQYFSTSLLNSSHKQVPKLSVSGCPSKVSCGHGGAFKGG